MVKQTFKILMCKIFKVYLTIFQHETVGKIESGAYLL